MHNYFVNPGKNSPDLPYLETLLAAARDAAALEAISPIQFTEEEMAAYDEAQRKRQAMSLSLTQRGYTLGQIEFTWRQAQQAWRDEQAGGLTQQDWRFALAVGAATSSRGLILSLADMSGRIQLDCKAQGTVFGAHPIVRLAIDRLRELCPTGGISAYSTAEAMTAWPYVKELLEASGPQDWDAIASELERKTDLLRGCEEPYRRRVVVAWLQTLVIRGLLVQIADLEAFDLPS